MLDGLRVLGREGELKAIQGVKKKKLRKIRLSLLKITE